MNTPTTQLNGLDVDRLVATIGHIRENPELARFEFRSETNWQTGGRTRTSIQGFHGAGTEDTSRSEPLVLVGDEPPVLLGTNEGPNAVEALLHSLASCLAVGFVYNAAARGMEIRSLGVSLTGQLDLRAFLGIVRDVRPGYESIEVRYRVDTDATHEEIVDLCGYVQETSPVLDMLRNPVPVSIGMVS